MNFHIHNAYITSQQKDWLAKHPEFNFSGFVRQQLEKQIKK